MKGETRLHRAIMADCGNGAVRLFRNNCGLAVHTHADGSETRVVYGLVPGSHDLIGWRSVIITPAMIGQRFARFASIEVKTGAGTMSDKQENFMRVVLEAGGISGEARSIEEARKLLGL